MHQAKIVFSLTLNSGFKVLASSSLSATSQVELQSQIDDFKQTHHVESISRIN